MLKAHWKLISRIERVADNLLVIACFFFAYRLRDVVLKLGSFAGLSSPAAALPLGPIEGYFVVLGLALPLYNAVLSMLGAYRSMRFSSLPQIFKISVLSSLVVFFSAGAGFFLLKMDPSRSLLGTFCALTGLAHFAERVVVLKLLRYYRVRGKNFRNVLIVGTGKQARDLHTEIVKQPELGLRVAGFVDLRGRAEEQAASVGLRGRAFRVYSQTDSAGELSMVYDLPARVVADAESFERALKKYAVDEVLFTDPMLYAPYVKELAEIAVDEGVGVTLAADFFALGIKNSDTSSLGSTPLIHYRPSPGDTSRLALKRLIDIVVSALLLIALSPLFFVVALLIKLTSPGPVFYKQRRMGLNGRTFILLKFRSMRVGADRELEDLREHNEMQGPVFKMADDPRITGLGRWLRRYSIDELPQLFNVFVGQMSLVGPRPPLPEEVSLYMRKQRRRLSMRPGLTCTWQVSGRNEIPDFEQWAKLDLEYIDNWSLKRDFQLLLRTIPAVLSGSGAR